MQYFTYLALFATSVLALPLNINLGAYSPALVVGDGEISFGGGEEAAALIGTLQGTAGTAAGTKAAEAKAAEIASGTATGATVITPGEVTSVESNLPLSGIGKNAVSPRDPEVNVVDVSTKEKRDLAGFNAALAFATGALTTAPEVQLGTGEGGSGVGIIQKAGGTPKTAAGGAAAGGEKAARDIGDGTTVTLLKIRTLGDSPSAKQRRDGSPVRRAVEVDEDGNLNLNLDGEVELVIAEVQG